MSSATRLAVYAFSSILFVHSLSAPGSCQSQSTAKLYFFTNASCGPCRQVEPELEELHREGFSITKIDTFAYPDWTRQYQVTRTPTVVLVADGKEVARHTGFVDAATLRQWFQRFEPAATSLASHSGLDRQNTGDVIQTTTTRSNPPAVLPATRHRGTNVPANDVERLALQATVRLKVDDPQGSSYATGTVIHYRDGEALVLTCGHVFRDSQGRGTISAEYGFADGQIRRTRGELLDYNAEERDIGLVVITTDQEIRPVPVAMESYPLHHGDQIFSIGCDHGQAPTIRRSRLKNQARYDGIFKYEIFGRPVDGRSGGGLFTAGGQLVGVCNAAVVDADEGVYVALDTIHWQFQKQNLSHLFNAGESVAANRSLPPDQPPLTQVVPRPPAVPMAISEVPVRDRVSGSLPPTTGNQIRGASVVRANIDSHPVESELIVVLRSRSTSGVSQSWTVENPSPALIQQLQQMSRSPLKPDPVNQMARLRQTMSDSPPATGPSRLSGQVRAQSPR